MQLKVGLPKGSLEAATLNLFVKAGYRIEVDKRCYFVRSDAPELNLMLLRAQEMSRYVESGVLDCGITGRDWICENNSEERVVIIKELIYAKKTSSKVRWVLAVAEDSPIRSAADLSGKTIATELVNVTTRYLKEKGIKARVEFSWGATEMKVSTGLVDAIVELTETGMSLRAHNLREIDTVCTSVTQLIANKRAYYKDVEKRQKIEEIALLLSSSIEAEGKVGLKMDVPKPALAEIMSILPALYRPTISPLWRKDIDEKEWFAVDTVIDEVNVRRLIPCLKRAGAEGIVEYSLNKVVY